MRLRHFADSLGMLSPFGECFFPWSGPCFFHSALQFRPFPPHFTPCTSYFPIRVFRAFRRRLLPPDLPRSSVLLCQAVLGWNWQVPRANLGYSEKTRFGGGQGSSVPRHISCIFRAGSVSDGHPPAPLGKVSVWKDYDYDFVTQRIYLYISRCRHGHAPQMDYLHALRSTQVIQERDMNVRLNH